MVNDPNGAPDPDATRLNPQYGAGAPDADATRVNRPLDADATRVNRPLDADATRVGQPVDDGDQHWTARASVPPAGAFPRSDAPADWDERPDEDPYGGRSWFTPVIAGLVGLVLVAVVGFGVWLIYRNVNSKTEPVPSASAQPSSAAPVPSSAPPTTQSPTPSPTPSSVSPSAADEVPIPSVRGDTEQSAIAQLNQLGFVVVVERRVDPTIRPGRVIDTDPPAGQTLPNGGTITLIVAAAAPSPSVSPSPGQS